jgi:hypothetical protein
LSKSDGDAGVRELRARGWTAEQVIDAALSSCAGNHEVHDGHEAHEEERFSQEKEK